MKIEITRYEELDISYVVSVMMDCLADIFYDKMDFDYNDLDNKEKNKIIVELIEELEKYKNKD